MKKIYIIGSYSDKTTRYTAERLKANKIDFEFLDTGMIVMHGDLSFDPIQREGRLDMLGKTYIFNSDSRFYIRLLDISSAAPTEELKIRTQRIQLLLSNMFDVLDTKTLNPPNRANYNLSKLFHLGQVKMGNLLVPPSLCSTDKDKIINFCEKYHWDVIVKGCSSSKTIAQQLSRESVARLELVSKAPPLFQKRVRGIELRVHMVGDDSFAELIATEEIDYRFPNKKAKIVTMTVRLDAALEKDMKALISHLNMPMLGIDLKLDEDSERWYFLEANPIPCYYGYDIRSGYKISRRICDFLAG